MLTRTELEKIFLQIDSQLLSPVVSRLEELEKRLEDLSNAQEERPKARTRRSKRVQQTEENTESSD